MNPSTSASRRVLVAGCGYSGLAIARLFHAQGWAVAACTRSPESAAALSGEPFQTVSCDLADRESIRRLAPFAGIDFVIHCASSGRGGAEEYRQVYLQGAQNLAETLSPGRLLFTSSTSVYAQTTGEWVTEESVADPERETGRILRETEDFVCECGGIVARLAGIYGPGRSMLLRKFLSGEAAIEGDGSRSINQIHRDDIATALLALARHAQPGIFNVCDNSPMSQRALYEGLATRFARLLPPSGPIDTDRKRGWTDKKVSNGKLRGLGWEPAYPAFFDAVERDPELIP